MNGDMLEELKKMEANGEAVPAKVTNRLLLTVTVQLVKSVQEIHTEFNSFKTNFEEYRNGVEAYRKERMEAEIITGEQIKRLGDCVGGLQQNNQVINGNLAVRLGQFVSARPKLTVTLLVIFVVVVQFLLVGGLEADLLTALGLSPGLVSVLRHLAGTPIP